jgi:hypothetical protein
MVGNSFTIEVNEAMSIVDDELKKYKITLGKGVLRIFAEDVISMLYLPYDYSWYGWYEKESIRGMTVASILCLSMPIIKEELIKNKVVMEGRDIWFMTYDIVQETRKNSRGYSDHELRKIAQEHISKQLYKKYIGLVDELNYKREDYYNEF